MRPKLVVIMVTGCHLIPVICARRELADLEHDRAIGKGLANHRVPVMTDHAPGGKPESVIAPSAIEPEHQSLDDSSDLLHLCASFRI